MTAPFLVHVPPQVMLNPIHRDEDFVQVPLRSEPSSHLFQPGSVGGAELVAPFPDCFIRHRDTSLRHHLLDVPVA
jgi:hypothetical protein